MERIKFSIHFSYILAVALCLLLGRLIAFAVYSVTIILHELAHYIVARKLFYQCTKLQISAFGAVLYGEFDNARGYDQIKIALAGPIANIVLAIILVALWWVEPETYPYTDALVLSNLSMAAINLIPAYPMDGGRILLGILQSRDRGDLATVKKITLGISIVLFVVFVSSVIANVTLFSLGIFALSLCAGYCIDNDGRCYVRLTQYEILCKRMAIGVEKKTLIFAATTNWGQVVMRLSGHYLYNIEVNDGGNLIGIIDYVWLDQLIRNCPTDSTLGQIIADRLYK